MSDVEIALAAVAVSMVSMVLSVASAWYQAKARRLMRLVEARRSESR